MTATMSRDVEPVLVELVHVPASGAARAVREMTFRANAWLPEEDARLRELFAADMPMTEIAAALGRAFHATRSRVMLLGLRRNSTRPWTQMEDAEVARRYGFETAEAIALDLGRGVSAVYGRARLLGVAEAGSPDWTPWEDAQLIAGYAQGLPAAEIAILIGRSYFGVNSRAFALGVRHKHHPVGWSHAEVTRALELAHEGHRYLAIIDMLAGEGYPRRTKASLSPLFRKMGYGRGWGRRWTSEEDDLLRGAYARGESVRALGRALNRTACSMIWRAGELGLKGTHVSKAGWRTTPVWTPEDDAKLRELYGKVPTRELAARLGRVKHGVLQRAHKLGLNHGYFRPYEPAEVLAIQIAWRQGLPIRVVAQALGRQTAAVHRQLSRLDIDFSDPDRPMKPVKKPGYYPAYTLAEILALEAPATAEAA